LPPSGRSCSNNTRQEFAKKVYESAVRRREAALGLLDQTLLASNDLTSRPVELILRELTLQNALRGEFR
jgi:hypothetical protein